MSIIHGGRGRGVKARNVALYFTEYFKVKLIIWLQISWTKRKLSSAKHTDRSECRLYIIVCEYHQAWFHRIPWGVFWWIFFHQNVGIENLLILRTLYTALTFNSVASCGSFLIHFTAVHNMIDRWCIHLPEKSTKGARYLSPCLRLRSSLVDLGPTVTVNIMNRYSGSLSTYSHKWNSYHCDV